MDLIPLLHLCQSTSRLELGGAELDRDMEHCCSLPPGTAVLAGRLQPHTRVKCSMTEVRVFSRLYAAAVVWVLQETTTPASITECNSGAGCELMRSCLG